MAEIGLLPMKCKFSPLGNSKLHISAKNGEPTKTRSVLNSSHHVLSPQKKSRKSGVAPINCNFSFVYTRSAFRTYWAVSWHLCLAELTPYWTEQSQCSCDASGCERETLIHMQIPVTCLVACFLDHADRANQIMNHPVLSIIS